METNKTNYETVRDGAVGFFEQKRGLCQVSGKEAIAFLNGMITNDVAKLADGDELTAAFPNAQGRLLALVRILRSAGKFFIETAAEAHEKIYKNLFRFTFAGDFFVEDLSENYRYFEVVNDEPNVRNFDALVFRHQNRTGYFVPCADAESFVNGLKNRNAVEISPELQETLRIENGEPIYGTDADETTIVPELGDDAISYTKGCYIGQEIIARIHFRGHVAKKLTGLILESNADAGAELKSIDGKNAGKITSVTYSPKLEKFIALGFVRYDFLADGTELKVDEIKATVKNLPFIK